jgi:hypothetical protein
VAPFVSCRGPIRRFDERRQQVRVVPTSHPPATPKKMLEEPGSCSAIWPLSPTRVSGTTRQANVER